MFWWALRLFSEPRFDTCVAPLTSQIYPAELYVHTPETHTIFHHPMTRLFSAVPDTPFVMERGPPGRNPSSKQARDNTGRRHGSDHGADSHARHIQSPARGNSGLPVQARQPSRRLASPLRSHDTAAVTRRDAARHGDDTARHGATRDDTGTARQSPAATGSAQRRRRPPDAHRSRQARSRDIRRPVAAEEPRKEASRTVSPVQRVERAQVRRTGEAF